MISCKKKIILAYGGLALIVAFFAVPVRRTTSHEEIQSSSYYRIRKTTDQYGYTSLAAYLSAGRAPRAFGFTGKMTTTLRPAFYVIEIGTVIFVGMTSWILFCVFLKRKRRE